MSSNLEVIYFHILQKNNGLANNMENRGVKNKMGIVSIRDQNHFKHVP